MTDHNDAAGEPPQLEEHERLEGERMAAAHREREHGPTARGAAEIDVPAGWTPADVFGAIVAQAEPVDDTEERDG